MEIRRIGTLSLARVLGMLYALVGLAGGLFLALFGEMLRVLMGVFPQGEMPEPWIGELFGLKMILLVPLFYGAVGFVSGLLVALLYNFLAGLVGGIELEVSTAEADIDTTPSYTL